MTSYLVTYIDNNTTYLVTTAQQTNAYVLEGFLYSDVSFSLPPAQLGSGAIIYQGYVHPLPQPTRDGYFVVRDNGDLGPLVTIESGVLKFWG